MHVLCCVCVFTMQLVSAPRSSGPPRSTSGPAVPAAARPRGSRRRSNQVLRATRPPPPPKKKKKKKRKGRVGVGCRAQPDPIRAVRRRANGIASRPPPGVGRGEQQRMPWQPVRPRTPLHRQQLNRLSQQPPLVPGWSTTLFHGVTHARCFMA